MKMRAGFDPHITGYELMVFLSIIGLGFQLFQLMTNSGYYNLLNVSYGGGLSIGSINIAFAFVVPIVENFLIMLALVLGAYFTYAFINGIVSGSYSFGIDLAILFKIVAFAAVTGGIGDVPGMIMTLLNFGVVGLFLAIFIGLITFFAMFSLIYSFTR